MAKFKLKKGEFEWPVFKDVFTFLMILDSIDLPIDEVISNYNVGGLPSEFIYKLKEIGY